MEDKWWHHSVIYQIYPRSFRDSNGDGIGDIPGIIEKLDYLSELGIEIIWLSPVCKSPGDDNGYDISDYQDINPEFGTMEEMECLIAECKKRGIKIMMDMVFNHTSDEHPWFLEAKKSKENPYRDYYIWRDPVEGKEPNDLGSVFSGSAWEYMEETNQYYLHCFSKKQPDLNLENPKVRDEICDIITFWMKKGVGGFRFDVIELLGKVPDLKIKENGPKLHEYIQELQERSFGRADLVTVGECWAANPEIAKLYTDPERKELSMIFQFEHMTLDEVPGKGKWHYKPLDFLKLKEILVKWQLEYADGFNSLFWNNHDLPRIVSRFGDTGEYWKESAKMLVTLLHGMRGIPYVYQGEELGMTNVRFPSIEEYRDIETLNMYRERMEQGEEEEAILHSIYRKGRDNARTPMQWNADYAAGFSTGTPWIGVNENYTEINAGQQQQDENSILAHYKALIQLRKTNPTLVYGTFVPLLEEHEKVFAYERVGEKERLVILCNFFEEEQLVSLEKRSEKEQVRIVLSNYSNSATDLCHIRLRPYEAILYSCSEE